MNELLKRPLIANPASHTKSAAFLALCVGLMSASWYFALRPILSDVLARSYIGSRLRPGLIQSELRRRYPAITEALTAATSTQPVVERWDEQYGIGVSWSVSNGTNRSVQFVFDDELNLAGTIRSMRASHTWGDFDGDGKIELVFSLMPVDQGQSEGTTTAFIIRTSPVRNQLVAVVRSESSVAQGPIRYLGPSARHRPRVEMKLIETKSRSKYIGSVWDTVATFAWTRPGGTLIPTWLPPDGSVDYWPKDGNPISIPADVAIEKFVEEYLVSQTRTSPTSQPVSTAHDSDSHP